MLQAYYDEVYLGANLGEYFDAKREAVPEGDDTVLRVINNSDEAAQRHLQLLNIQTHLPERPTPVAYTMPFLLQKSCQYLIELVQPESFDVNSEEPEAAQIPEVVLLDKHPKVGKALCEDFFEYIEPVVQALYGYELSSIESAQLALYEADGRVPSGCLHTDEDSDLTVTVALNDDYEGGGLHIITGGVHSETVHIPKQPAGTATIFEGRTKVHMGQPVTAGSRYLLVFWCKI